MEFNIKKVPTAGWIRIGIAALIMILALIFKPDFDAHPVLVYSIAGVIGIYILYLLLRMTGILGKIFGKKK